APTARCADCCWTYCATATAPPPPRAWTPCGRTRSSASGHWRRWWTTDSWCASATVTVCPGEAGRGRTSATPSTPHTTTIPGVSMAPSDSRKQQMSAKDQGPVSGRPAWIVPAVLVAVLTLLVGGGYYLWDRVAQEETTGAGINPTD